jgi:glycosyltransferase involved in cell wall biosynthesis
MNGRLVVITTQVGASFINRHVEDVAPGRTVVVSRLGGHPLGGQWHAPCPTLYLDRWALRLDIRLAKRLGVSEKLLRDRAIERFLRRHNVEFVLGEYLDQFLDFVPLMERLRLPYVVQGHGIDLSARLREPGMAEAYLAYRSARAVLTRSEFHRRRLIRLGLPEHIVQVNRGGVDVPPEMPERPSGSERRLLALARVDVKKGPIFLLEAFRRAAAEDSRLNLDFAGIGPLLPAVRQCVDAFNLSSRVRLHGRVSDDVKHRLFRECGVFVQHSVTDPDTGDEEGLPAAIQEAMAAGMMVVSTRHAGIPEAVVDGETGLLVDEGNVAAMAVALLKAPTVAFNMGRAGYRRAAQSHSWRDEKARLERYLMPALTAEIPPRHDDDRAQGA